MIKICEDVHIREYDDGIDITVYDEFKEKTDIIYLEDETLKKIYNKRFGEE